MSATPQPTIPPPPRRRRGSRVALVLTLVTVTLVVLIGTGVVKIALLAESIHPGGEQRTSLEVVVADRAGIKLGGQSPGLFQTPHWLPGGSR